MGDLAPSIQALPTAILERVLLLALPKNVQSVIPEPCDALPLAEMRTLALVCRDWRAYAEQLYCRATPVDVVVTRKGFCVKRANERRVNPTVPDPDVEIVRVKIKDWEEGQETWTGDWHAVMKLLPNVRRLDLSKISIRNRHVVALLNAASTQCTRVEALLLTHVDWHITREHILHHHRIWGEEGGHEEEHEGDNDDDIVEDMDDESDDDDDDDFDDDSDEDGQPRVMYLGDGIPPGQSRYTTGHELDLVYDALYAALERWYKTGSNRGLRQLSILERRTVDLLDDNNRLIGTLAKFCPKIEYLEGSGSSKGASLRGNWTCDLDVWEQFCRSCMSLRKFDLQVVPFSDLYLSPFAATAKPQLRSLTLGYAEHENGIALRDLRVSPQVLASIFGSLPALEKLTFKCKGEPNGTLFELSTLLTDDLVAALITGCRRLRHLDWRIMCGAFDAQLRLAQFTDTSLVALATLPSFEHLDIPLVSTACTHDGLLAFARSNRSTASPSRTLQFELDRTGERGSVLAFLDRLLAEEEDLFAGPRLQMLLKTTILMSQEASNQLRARLAQRHVNAIFNRSYMLIGGEMPIRLVILGTSDGSVTDS